MSKDEFRKFQKVQCRHTFGRRRGKRSIYGCECCMPISLPKFKREMRRNARIRLKEDTRQLLRDIILL